MDDLILLYTNTISAIIWIVLLDTAGFCARLLIPVFVYFFTSSIHSGRYRIYDPERRQLPVDVPCFTSYAEQD